MSPPSGSRTTRPAEPSPHGPGRGPARTLRPALGRASGVMAAGTLLSRATGFLRTVAIGAAIGTHGLGDAYNVANTTPNVIYDLLLGGVLSSVVVPVLVSAAREDEDGGERFACSLLTLVGLALLAAVGLGLLAAPLLVRLYISSSAGSAERDLAVTFLRYFLPQVVFYGVGATAGAILNVRGRFGAPMVTPVLNNLVVIAVAVVMVFLPPRPPTVSSVSSTQVTVLGLGTTLGVVAMTLALLPSLRRAGFHYRPRLDLRHPGLGQAARLAGWVVVYVAVSQVGFLVVTRLLSAGVEVTTYTYAYQLFQLPHALIAVSVITALLPRMSGHAADGRLDLVRGDLSTGLRLTAVILVPAALGLLVLARPIAVVAFAHGASSVHDAGRIGSVLAAFAVALVPFSAFQLQLRAFYARKDSRTPALVNAGVTVVNVAGALVLASLLPTRDRAVGLALAFALAYAAGATVTTVLLGRRLGGTDATVVGRVVVRVAVAAGLGAAGADVCLHAVWAVAGHGRLAAGLGVVLGALLGGATYIVTATRMRVHEIRDVGGMLRGRLGGRPTQ